MNTTRLAVAGVVAGLLSAAAAEAASSVTVAPAIGTPAQVVYSRNFNSGLVVTASSNTNLLTAAGGYTVTCPNSVAFQPSRAPTFQAQAGQAVGTREVHVPISIPSTNSATGYDSWPASVKQTCNFQYVGRSSDALVSSSGVGHGIVLSAGGAQDQTGSNSTFDMSRGATEGCEIRKPAQTALRLDGAMEPMTASRPRDLVRTGRDERGGPIVLDEYAMVLTGASGSYLQQATEGFDASSAASGGAIGVRPSPNAVDRQQVSFQPESIGSNAMLLVQHQRAHPLNSNFAPAPVVTSTPQPMQGSPPQRGFAVVSFGRSGEVQRVRILPANAGEPSPQLFAAMRKLMRTEFVDMRRHDHTAYVAYEVLGGTLHSVGSALVTYPLCCPCPPPPPGQLPEPC